MRIISRIIWLETLLLMTVIVWTNMPRNVVAAPIEQKIDTSAAKLFNEGRQLFEAGEFDKALPKFEKALSSFHSQQMYMSVADTHLFIDQIHYAQQKLDLALSHYQQAEQIYREINDDPWRIGAIMSNIGDIHYDRGEIKKAQQILSQALKTLDDSKCKRGCGLCSFPLMQRFRS